VISGCATPSSILFDDEFDSLNGEVWSTMPSLTPFKGFEGSNTPGEVNVENGILKLSRYAAELAGENPVSYIQTNNLVYLPAEYSVTIRFKNEFVGFAFGKLYVAIYNDKIWVGQDGIGPQADGFDYLSNDDSYFILSLRVTGSGYSISIMEDAPGSIEETFSKNIDLSDISGDSVITIMGGSNTTMTPYSEIDYIRIGGKSAQ
jgi:hypothetical protein